MLDSAIELSVVIPCYNSTQMIGQVIDRIRASASLRYQESEYEIILVDDCSPDGTAKVVYELSKRYSNVRAASLARNFGQQSAVVAGYSLAQGKLIMTMDDDGETPPESMLELVAKIDEGYDVVYATYPANNHSLFRRLGSKVNDLMARWLLGKPKGLELTSYVVCRRFVVEQILRHQTPFPYTSGQILATTKRICSVEVAHGMRIQGSSGYSIRKLLSLWLNGFTAFSVKPLRVASIMGIIVACIGLIAAIFVIVRAIVAGVGVQGWASTMSIILLLGGAVLFVLGMAGEYIGRIYMTMNNIPEFIIRPWHAFGFQEGDIHEDH